MDRDSNSQTDKIGMSMKDTLKKVVLFLPAAMLALVFLLMKKDTLVSIYLLNYAALILLGYLVAYEDLQNMRVPNMMLLIMLAVWSMIRIPAVFSAAENGLLGLADSLIGALVGGGLFLLVYIISRKGLGGGDVKFMAVAGLYLGFAGVLPTMLIGSVLSGVYGLTMIGLKKMDKEGTMPLVPFLYAGIIITLYLY